MKQSELVALALIADRPRYPYELNKRIEDMRLRQWAKLGASTLYVVLDRLARDKLVRVSEQKAPSRPARKVYAITAKGRKALKSFLEEGLTAPDPVYSDRLVAAIFAQTAGEDLCPAFATARKQMKITLDRLAQASKTSGLSKEGRTILEFQASLIKAEQNALAALQMTEQKAKDD